MSEVASKKSPKTVEDFKKLTIGELAMYIQTRWNQYNAPVARLFMTESRVLKMQNALIAFRDNGGDLSYFTCGNGAPRQCLMM